MKKVTPKHDGERIARTELRRDKGFKAQLARAWDVEKLPDSLTRRVEKTMAELPEELVVKVRPMQVFRRGMATAALCCVALFAALFLLNLSQPQFTESLPGLGGVFRAVNDKMDEYMENAPAPTPAPSPSSDPAETEILAEDNQIQLKSAAYQPAGSSLVVTARMPFVGRESYFLAEGYGRLGTFGVFQAENGLVITAGAVAMEEEIPSAPEEFQGTAPLTDTYSPLPEEPVDVVWHFSLEKDRDPAILKKGVFTVYEASAWHTWGAGSPYENAGKRVLAQFAIDLSKEDAPIAYPTDQYKNEGLQKISPEECLSTQRAVFPESGWMASDLRVVSRSDQNWLSPEHYDTYYKIVVYEEKSTYRPVVLNCYYGEDLVTTVENYTASPVETGDVPTDHSFLDEYIGDQYWFASEGGYWTEWNTDESRTGKPYRRMVFAVPTARYNIQEGQENAYALLSEEGMMRFELMDARTGEVLIEDIEESINEWRVGSLSRWSGLCAPQASPSPLPEAIGSEVMD